MERVILIMAVALVIVVACVLIEMVVVAHKCRRVHYLVGDRDYWRSMAEDNDELLDRISILNANLDRLRPKYDADECKCHNNTASDNAKDGTPDDDTAA